MCIRDSIHGIRDFGKWQDNLGEILKSNLDENDISEEDFRYESYKYGYFSVVAFIIPIFRFLVVRKFSRKLASLLEKKWDRVDLVGLLVGLSCYLRQIREFSNIICQRDNSSWTSTMKSFGRFSPKLV